MNKNSNETARDLMFAWIKGWSGYIQEPKDDYPAILSIAEKCSNVAQISIDEEEGYMRIKNGLANIATFCSGNTQYRSLNLFKIDKQLQSILIEMNAWRKSKASEKDKMMQDHMLYEERKRLKETNEREKEKERIKSLKWAIDTWDYIWEHSEQVAIKTNYSTCLSREEAIKDLETKPIEHIEKLKEQVKEMKDRWIEDYKKSA